MKRHAKDDPDRKLSENTSNESNEKKPFNKKKYRLQKYSNKYKSRFEIIGSTNGTYT